MENIGAITIVAALLATGGSWGYAKRLEIVGRTNYASSGKRVQRRHRKNNKIRYGIAIGLSIAAICTTVEMVRASTPTPLAAPTHQRADYRL